MKITKTDIEYVLQNEAGDQLTLTAQELAELVRDAHRVLHPNAKFQPLATMQVVDAVLSIDAHHTEAILRLIGADGAKQAFAIRAKAVRFLAEAFARKADLIDAGQSKKTER